MINRDARNRIFRTHGTFDTNNLAVMFIIWLRRDRISLFKYEVMTDVREIEKNIALMGELAELMERNIDMVKLL